MKLPIKASRCLICCKNEPNSWEHIIPECIGGRIEARLLCTNCNSRYGSTLVSQIKDDPSIQYAVQSLKDKIPDIAKKLQENQSYFGKDNTNNIIPMRQVKGKIKVIPCYQENGSLIYDSSDAPIHIQNMLKKSNIPDEIIESILRIFPYLENDKLYKLPGDLSFIKRNIQNVQFLPNGNLMDERVIVLIAYEFLYLWFGEQILKPVLDPVRKFIRGNNKPSNLNVEYLSTRKYNPFHRLVLSESDKTLIVYVCFFEWLVYKVEFGELLKKRTQGGMYIEDLVNKLGFVAKTIADHRKGNYYVLYKSKPLYL